MRGGVVLITLHRDLRLLRLAQRPMGIVAYDERGRLLSVDVIPKTAIVCDACNSEVAESDEDVGERGLPTGYAVITIEGGGAYLSEVVCQKCREMYFSKYPSFDTIEEAEHYSGLELL